jgi:hypothetical protein
MPAAVRANSAPLFDGFAELIYIIFQKRRPLIDIVRQRSGLRD